MLETKQTKTKLKTLIMSNLTKKTEPRLRIESNYIGYLDTRYLSSYADAVNHLHQMLAIRGEWEWMLKEYPKATYTVWIMRGEFDKYDNEVTEKVYTITSAKIRKIQKLGITL